ncbi:MAG: ABC transporter substrate-binding protein [Zetaproteobacteria bacterium]|nr:MAG: ABC transporter substrate-binding protein [Zetaproteobacteria bacterium]
MKHSLFGIMLSLVLLLPFSAVAADEFQDPKAVVQTIVSGIIDVLEQREDKTKLVEADREKIRHIVNGRFDYAAMAKRSLGEPWMHLDEAEKAHFTDVFRQLLEYSYGNRLKDYKGETVQYRDVEYRGSKARVLTIVSDGTKDIPVEYRLHKTDHGWSVYDIRIEGASLVRTFYQDFQAQLAKLNYQQLVKALEEKIARMKEEG